MGGSLENFKILNFFKIWALRVNIPILWNAGTACVSECVCVLKTLACRGLRVGLLRGTSWIQQSGKNKTHLNKMFTGLSRDWVGDII